MDASGEPCTKNALEWSQINEACDQFEAGLRQGLRPSISGRLTDVPEYLCNDLIYELARLTTEVLPTAKYNVDEHETCERIEAIFRNSLFDRFHSLKYIGSGGFGFVFLAFDTKHKRSVSLKIARTEIVSDPKLRSLFLREVKSAGKLDHPNLGKVLDSGEFADAVYITSEYEPGSSLKQIIAESKSHLDYRWAARITREVARGIHHAHEAGVIHCDLNPGNIIVEGPGGLNPKAIDFGIARVLGEPSELSRTGELFGTPGFIAPEQATGRRALVDSRTDVYGLGAVLYACLLGKAPFHAESTLETLTQVLRDEVEEPRAKRRDIPPDLQAICLRCLEKAPAKRFQSVQELADDLDRFLSASPTLTRPPSSLVSLNRWARKNPVTAAFGVAAIIGVALGIGFLVWHDASLRGINANLTTVVGELKKANDDLKARQLAAIAQARRDRLERYAADMRQAAGLLQSEDTNEIRAALEQWQPASGEEDLRGFEWYYLRKQIEPAPISPLWSGKRGLYAVAYSPDGDKIAVAGADHMLRLIDVRSGKEIHPPREHAGEIGCIDYSRPDIIVTSCDDGMARIWPVSGGSPVELRGHKGKLLSAALSPNGKLLATGGFDMKLYVWDLSKSKPEYQDVGHSESRITALAWDLPGSKVYVGQAEEGIVTEWDLKSGKSRRVTNIYKGAIVGVHPIYNGDMLAVLKIGIFDGMGIGNKYHPEVQTQFTHRLGTERINGSATNSPGSLLALARDGRIELWDLTRKMRSNVFRGQGGREWSVSFSPDGRTIASGGADGALHLWAIDRVNSSKGTERAVLCRGISAVGFNESSTELFWKVADEARAYKRGLEPSPSGGISSIEPSPGTAFTANSRGAFVAVEPSGRASVFAQNSLAYIGTVKHIAPSRLGEKGGWVIPEDSSWLASHDEHNITITKFNGYNESILIPANDSTGKMAAHKSGLVAACYPLEKKIMIWNVDTGNKIFGWDFDETPWNIAFSPDGKRIAVGVTGTVRILNLEDRREETRLLAWKYGYHSNANVMAFDPNGRTLATSNIDGSINLWQIETGRMLMGVKNHSKTITNITFSPDGRCLASVGYTGIQDEQNELVFINTK